MLKLKIYLAIFFIALAIPITVLLNGSYDQLQSERILATRDKAGIILKSINRTIAQDLKRESIRSYSEYRFLMAIEVLGGEGLALSPLAEFPAKSSFVGLLGHFQIEPDGEVRTPFVPDGHLAQLKIETKSDRLIAKDKVRRIILAHKLQDLDVVKKVTTKKLNISGVDIEGVEFSGLQITKLNDDNSDARFESSSEKADFVFEVESEVDDADISQVIQPHTKSNVLIKELTNQVQAKARPQIDAKFYGVEVHPFKVLVGEHHLIFHRDVFKGGERYVQGFVVNVALYLNSIVSRQLELSINNELAMRFSNIHQVLMTFQDTKLKYEGVYQSQLKAPFDNLTLDIGLPQIGSPPGAILIYILAVLITLLLGMGSMAIYKLANTHVSMSRKRSDFISAVSHELKTPLTAIRMYCEMLEIGFVANEEKRQSYYAKISSESNRLSRLIQNVLDLSKIERNSWSVELKPYVLSELIYGYRDTWNKNLEQRGFEVEFNLKEEVTVHMLDKDAFIQILVNIVENSIKFSANSPKKKIEIQTKLKEDYTELRIRDFGPGVPSSEVSKIFEVFYRVENEMIRSTSGTGIGLSLVKKFSDEMKMKIEAKNVNPGLMIIIHIPMASI